MQSKIDAKRIRRPNVEGVGHHPRQSRNPDTCGSPCFPHEPAPSTFHSVGNGDNGLHFSSGITGSEAALAFIAAEAVKLIYRAASLGLDALLIGLRCNQNVKFMKPMRGNELRRVHYIDSNELWPNPKNSLENFSKVQHFPLASGRVQHQSLKWNRPRENAGGNLFIPKHDLRYGAGGIEMSRQSTCRGTTGRARISSTGFSVLRVTFSAMLPMTNRSIPLLPWVAIATRSNPSRSA